MAEVQRTGGILSGEKPYTAEVWYRLEVVTYSHLDEWENVYFDRPQVSWREYEVVKTTPKGVWVTLTYFGEKRFILRDAKKRFACPTKAEAKESFIFRKKRHIKILTAQLKEAQEALRVGEKAQA
jgi:hypothetical protein